MHSLTIRFYRERAVIQFTVVWPFWGGLDLTERGDCSAQNLPICSGLESTNG